MRIKRLSHLKIVINDLLLAQPIKIFIRKATLED